MRIVSFVAQVAEYQNYAPVPVPVRDLKALAAYINALADRPETVLNARIGTLGVTMNVEPEPEPIPE